jgi:steroid delta-isomerase-like uncharacterized protein
MSAADDKALVRRFWEELVGAGHFALADELLAPGYTVHYAGNPPMDRDGFLQFLGALRSAFLDLAVTVEDLLAEGDQVAVRWTWGGTHQGPFLGIPPTGKAVVGSGIGLFRIANGQIVEDFVQEDTFGLLQQPGRQPTHWPRRPSLHIQRLRDEIHGHKTTRRREAAATGQVHEDHHLPGPDLANGFANNGVDNLGSRRIRPQSTPPVSRSTRKRASGAAGSGEGGRVKGDKLNLTPSRDNVTLSMWRR